MHLNTHPRRRVLLFVFAAVLVGAISTIYVTRLQSAHKRAASNMSVLSPEQGRLVVSISSTGRVSARSTVSVGSQVSGEISEVGADFNQTVKKGQIIAKINPARYEALLTSASAALSGAQAALGRALRRSEQVDRDLRRKEDLAERQLISRSDLEQERDEKSETAMQVLAAKSSIKGLEAAVTSARYDLDQTFIRSPVDGVVLDRLIEPGQTVTASFETPVLFRIAEDLSKMKIELAVDEADIGSIKEGNKVEFTVDAFPERRFNGVVVQKRIAPNVQGNNATYPVIVSVINQDNALVPGMLADATINVAERTNTLKLPTEYIEAGSDSGGRVPLLHDIQKAIQSNVDLMGLSTEQLTAFRKVSRNELPEQPKQENVPPELVKFFGAAAAASIVVIDDASGDPEIAIKKDRLRRLHERFNGFRKILSPAQRLQWDQLLSDLVNSRFAKVVVDNGQSSLEKSILVGMSDESSTQILDGLTTRDRILLPTSDSQ